jgi:hypothetical protein
MTVMEQNSALKANKCFVRRYPACLHAVTADSATRRRVLLLLLRAARPLDRFV